MRRRDIIDCIKDDLYVEAFSASNDKGRKAIAREILEYIKEMEDGEWD